MSDERSELLAFLGVFRRRLEETMPPGHGLPPEAFAIPPKVPLSGLRMAVGDMLEMTTGITVAETAEIERQLSEAGAPSLADIRRRYSKKLAGILKRGMIRSEAEYYLVRSFAEGSDPQGDGAALWALIGRFEAT